MVVSAIDFRSR